MLEISEGVRRSLEALLVQDPERIRARQLRPSRSHTAWYTGRVLGGEPLATHQTFDGIIAMLETADRGPLYLAEDVASRVEGKVLLLHAVVYQTERRPRCLALLREDTTCGAATYRALMAARECPQALTFVRDSDEGPLGFIAKPAPTSRLAEPTWHHIPETLPLALYEALGSWLVLDHEDPRLTD